MSFLLRPLSHPKGSKGLKLHNYQLLTLRSSHRPPAYRRTNVYKISTLTTPSSGTTAQSLAIRPSATAPPLPLTTTRYNTNMATTTAAAKSKNPLAEQPPWQVPAQSSQGRTSQLKLYNSLTRNKNPFIALDPRGKKVTWYCCGPTVYDAAHLGHARNYVTTDCLRRILEGYFGYDVQFVQNVTDIDDKIILKARQSHLFNNFVAKYPSPTSEVTTTVGEAWKAYLLKAFKTDDAEPSTFIAWANKQFPKHVTADGAIVPTSEDTENLAGEDLEKEAKTKMHLRTLLVSAKQLVSPDTAADAFYAAVKDVLAPYLDSKDGHSITDPKVFRETAAFWEKQFDDDMRLLNVLPPTNVTRVSEFVPENVDFVKKLVDKGFAYPVADGSVYFDVEAYRNAGHFYAKLKPWNVGNQALLADGEGALTSQTGEKKNSGDFALWKGSKPGEPGWDSPWGKGRPGWHIECSVMCSEVLGGNVDIHSGGIDLAFPHHDNEIAQSEAYWDPCTVSEPGEKGKQKHQWINYFIHMGHLEISGAKMSKSLKNFVSIREALSTGGGWTSRRLRIVFLMGSWKDRIEIREGVIKEARTWENTVDKFFTNVKSLRAEQAELEAKGQMPEQLFSKREAALYKDFDAARTTLDEALCDSFNTASAMSAIADIISKANIYITESSSTYLSIALLSDIARWVTKMANIFGLDSAPISPTSIGWSHDDPAASGGAAAGNKEEVAMPYLRVLSGFRDKVRAVAVSGDVSKQKLLELCDKLRDDDLPPLGVVLDDRDSALGKPALVKFENAEKLLQEKAEKEAKAREKEEKKEAAKREREKAEREKLEKGRVPPELLFKEGEGSEKYSEWDAEGLPIKDKEGKEVAKSQLKKLKALQDKQRKAHEAWLAWKEKEGEKADVAGKD